MATAFSLAVNTPMIYIHPPATDKADVVEGIFVRGQSCLIIDDLITGGGSILQTAATLTEAGLVVRDAVTLIDRQEGGRPPLIRPVLDSRRVGRVNLPVASAPWGPRRHRFPSPRRSAPRDDTKGTPDDDPRK